MCDRCLFRFHNIEELSNHELECASMNKCSVRLPEPGNNILKFQNFHHKLAVPFIIYEDFECMLQPVVNYKYIRQQHEAYSAGFYLKCSYHDRISKYRSYRQKKEGEQPVGGWFVENLLNVAATIGSIYDNPIEINLSEEEEEFSNARSCHICGKGEECEEDTRTKVWDHCHLSGKYRGAAHNQCNLRFQHSRIGAVVFHI